MDIYIFHSVMNYCVHKAVIKYYPLQTVVFIGD